MKPSLSYFLKLAASCVGITLVGFFYSQFDRSAWSILLLVLFVLLLMAILYFGYRLTNELRKPKAPQTSQGKQRIHHLMEHGEWIEVDLTQCEVLEGGFYEEVREDVFTEHMRQSAPLLAALGDLNQDPLKKSHSFVHQSQVRFRHQKEGVEETFYSDILPMDRATVLFKAYDHGKTWLWVDRENRKDYFMDIRFLFEDKKQ